MAQVGSTLDLTGESSDEKMAVTVVKVINRGHGADMFSSPDHGKRFFAVQFRLRNIGTTPYNDSPSNGAQVVDSSGQSYDSDFNDIRHCQSFPGSEVIAPGSTGLGCIVFQVGKQATSPRSSSRLTQVSPAIRGNGTLSPDPILEDAIRPQLEAGGPVSAHSGHGQQEDCLRLAICAFATDTPSRQR